MVRNLFSENFGEDPENKGDFAYDLELAHSCSQKFESEIVEDYEDDLSPTYSKIMDAFEYLDLQEVLDIQIETAQMWFSETIRAATAA